MYEKNTVIVNEEGKKSLKNHLKDVNQKAKEKASQAVEWMKENKEIAAVCIPVAYAVTKQIVKSVIAMHKENSRDCRIYDRSIDYWWTLKRPMTNDEILRFEERKNLGEPCGQILHDMRLLK